MGGVKEQQRLPPFTSLELVTHIAWGATVTNHRQLWLSWAFTWQHREFRDLMFSDSINKHDATVKRTYQSINIWPQNMPCPQSPCGSIYLKGKCQKVSKAVQPLGSAAHSLSAI